MTSHFGRYRVLQKLGQGAMSAVFLARDPTLARLVAIKVLHQDLTLHRLILDRFFKEAKIAARIRSPHVVEVYDFGQEGRNPYLVMEFIDGRSVQKVLDQLDGRPLDPVVAASLLCQAAEGLSMAADNGVVHRDLKPDNLMLSESGYLKITDFGISHLAEHTVTRTGQVLGSPRFMSPEQVKGLKPITFQSDMFSLGAVLFYFLSGRTPFQAATIPDLHRQITEELHPSLFDLRPGSDPILARLVDVLLQKDPAKRGDGPRWLQTQLRTYLHMKRVIDPVSQVAAYMANLSAEGIQTTCNLNRAAIQQYMGSFDLDHRSETSRGKWKWAAAAVLGVGITAGSVAVGRLIRGEGGLHAKDGAVQASTELTPTVAKREQKPKPVAANPVDAPTHRRESKSIPASRGLDQREAVPSREQASQTQQGDAVVSIYSAPPFAELSIDGLGFGRTPLEGRTLPSGKYRIVLRPKVGREVDTVLKLAPGPQVHRFTLLDNPESRDP